MIIDNARSLVITLCAKMTASALSDAYAVVRAVEGQLHRDDIMMLRNICRMEYQRQTTQEIKRRM